MNLSEVKWIVQDRMISNTSYENLPDIIRSLGMECAVMSYENPIHWLETKKLNPFKPGDCVIPYVTVPMARKLNTCFGMYLNEHRLKYYVYTSLSNIPIQDYLNSDAILTTFKHFQDRKYEWEGLLKSKKLFIRPDSGMKLFTGFSLDTDDIDYQLTYLKNTALNDDSLMWVSREKTFHDETRFIISGNQVVDGSIYARNSGNDFVEDKNYPRELLALAEKVANATWKPEEVFTLDLCMTSEGPKIVEKNSFNCSGWYACDPEKVVKAVSEHTLKLYKDV